MATIVKRGEKWRVLVRRAGFPTRTGTFETKGAGQRWARQVELDMDQGRIGGGVVTGTVGDLLDRYAREMHVLGRAPSRNKQSVLDILNAGLGEVPVRRLSADRIIDYAKKAPRSGCRTGHHQYRSVLLGRRSPHGQGRVAPGGERRAGA